MSDRAKEAYDFIRRVAAEKATIVSSNDCSLHEIAHAQACNRFFIDDDNLGYVLRPKHAAAETAELRRQLAERERQLIEVAEKARAAMWDAHYGGGIDVKYAQSVDREVQQAINAAPAPPVEQGTSQTSLNVVKAQQAAEDVLRKPPVEREDGDKWRKLLTERSDFYISILEGLKYLANQPNMPTSNYGDWRRWASGCATRIEAALGDGEGK